MLDFLLSLLAGWPAILTTVILAVYGLVKNNYRFLLGAAILAVPFSWFLSGFPVVRSPIFLTPVLIFGAAWAMRMKEKCWHGFLPSRSSSLYSCYFLHLGQVHRNLVRRMKTKLIIFSGLPGTGKSTLASQLARELRLPLLCIDDVIGEVPSEPELRSGIRR
jgi:hypothetical protein